MARTSGSKNTKAPSKKASENVSKSGTRKSAAARSRSVDAEPRILDERTRRDIVGVGFIILGIVLFIAAAAPAGAIVTDFLSESLHVVFGVGCYIMPFFLIAIGGAVLYRLQSERMSLRITVGLSLILVALLGIIALFTPTTGIGPAALFDRIALVTHGGYVGAALAWVGLTLFGPVISGILLIGVAIAGVIIIGFSISAFLEKVRARYDLDGEGLASLVPDSLGSVRRGKKGTPLSTVADSLDMTSAHPQAPTARISLGEEPRRRGRSANFDGAAVTRQLGGQNTGTLVPIQAPDPRDVAEVEDISAAEPAAPMTRKLGRKRHEADKAERTSAETKPVRKKTPPKKKAPAQPVSKDGFQLPPMDLLSTGGGARRGSTEEELREVAGELQGTLEDFGVMAEVVGWVEGPTVTLFKVDLPSGVRVSKVTNLTDDIALALAAPGVRIFAPIPGTNYVGIEVPNRKRQMVYLPDVLASAGPGPLQVAIGEDVEGHSIVHDLAKMPHVLIAGTTGSGKSVEVNGMIMSILMRATPAEVRFIMVDPKRVEFAPYEGIPHLYVPVVTECREASSALSWAVAEMERRLKMFSKCGVRNIISFNEKARAAQAADEAAAKAGEEPPENPYGEPIPYIVIVIDELADLMMNVGKEVEFSISRIAQLARAAGIHLIIATQRPSTNVVTGLIKANITCRIGLTVASGIDSRVILDSTGAENLIGHGDLLIGMPEYPKPVRVQGPYVSDEEIAAVVAHLKAQGEPEYHSEILKTNVVTLGDSSPAGEGGSEADDPLLWEAADVVVSSDLGSTSNLQRRLKVGYARAGRIMDQLEEKGIVGPANGSRPREVLVDQMELETLKAFEATDNLE
ncbi:DNA translocase FtsK 4TM domain-containing protein [Adlercreutzia sp. R25]|uniref:DNA translocase FtsK 4TM domain-containing protein n=1 Tax=Adlercreutzia shanghongiae TaxID=3111773 RepID=A0ABU6IWQ6_9ACTN|nr:MULTISPECIES: DNA translocase FtsK 4TM domain-containing protein [unclassified Adlercreutzia]MEC4272410.1 DNA translocase FtsK 4TM domain-containing protein [Adlercreutzia sp. R25]MEC4294273.1 DNA translocase FtsK 4TM domain-containing protein [Adlercreutzia sp. R22]